MPAGDYLVHVGNLDDALGKPTYKFTREEDINIGNGDQFVPQIPPPSCAGAQPHGGRRRAWRLRTAPNRRSRQPHASATTFDIGGSPYEGQPKPLCDTKLVTLHNGKSVVPMFNVFTDVPLPGRFFGLIVDDLNFSSDPKSLLYGEKAGVPFAPVGIYDYANRLVTTVESDFNGLFDVLLPSTNRINCPTPSGVCANLYRFVGNDPGIPGRLNPNYNPQFRTIAAEFEAMPGLIIPADTAPTQVGVVVQLPGSQQNQAVSCTLNPAGSPATTPELFTVSEPYAELGGGFTITGQGFGASQGTGKVTLDGADLTVNSWNDRQIAVTVPANAVSGPHQLAVTSNTGAKTVNGLTFHVLSEPAGRDTPVAHRPGQLQSRPTRTHLGANWSQVLPGALGARRSA